MENNSISSKQKLEVAAKVYKLLKPFGKRTFAFGGFAAHLSGSQRKLNDLDFFVDFDSKEINFMDENKGSKILNYLNKKFSREFGDEFTGFKLSDDCTLNTTCKGVEVDIACRPALLINRDFENYKKISLGKDEIRVESPLSCVVHKAYAFVLRENLTKKLTDVYDMIGLISRNNDLKNWYNKLNKLKSETYSIKLNELRKNGKPNFMKSSLEEEFNIQLQQLIKKLREPEGLKILRDIFGVKREESVLQQISVFAKSIKDKNQERNMVY